MRGVEVKLSLYKLLKMYLHNHLVSIKSMMLK